MLDVSLIIISWNARQYLLDCLASIPLGLTRHHGEVIVVDNDSSDGSPEAVAERFSSVTLIRAGQNLGFAKANNLGIRRSSGRYVCLVNSDVTLLPGAIDTLIDYLDAQPHVGIVGPLVLNTDRTLQYSYWEFPSVRGSLKRTLALDTLGRRLTFTSVKNPDAASPAIRPVDVLSGCFMLIRRAALDQVGLLDDGFFFYGEDVDLCRRFARHGWAIHYNAEAQVIHAGGASSANAPIRFYLELQKANLRYWTKHYGACGRAYFLANALLHNLLRLAPQVLLYALRPAARDEAGYKIQRSTACINWVLHPSRR